MTVACGSVTILRTQRAHLHSCRFGRRTADAIICKDMERLKEVEILFSRVHSISALHLPRATHGITSECIQSKTRRLLVGKH